MSTQPARVSVVIPAYNCAKYLPAAVESALSQEGAHVQVVVVNDGSPDDTRDVVRPYLGRVRYIEQENRGLSAARNVGFRASHGEFVCFLDADDMLLPRKFDKQLAKFREEPDLGVVISGYIDVEEDGRTEILRVEKRWNRDALPRLLRHESFPVHTALIRREVLAKSLLFPEAIDTWESQEDWQLWLGMALDDVEFSSHPEPTCLYRHREGSIRQNPLRHNDGARRVVRWLRANPAAAAHRRAVQRLGAIVEMERVALAWSAGHLEESAISLRESIAADPEFWHDPATLRRLYLGSLSLPDVARWLQEPDVETMRRRLLDGILQGISPWLGRDRLESLRSLALLACADEAYAASDAPGCRRSVASALRASPRTCLTRQARWAVGRGLAGPRLGRIVGRGLRALRGGEW